MSPKVVTIGVPHKRQMEPEFVFSLVRLLINGPGGHKFHYTQEEGLYIHHNRKAIAEQALAVHGDYLLFLDTDMYFPEDAVARLIALNKPVSGGVYLHRIPPNYPMAYNFKGDEYLMESVTPLPSVPFKCDVLPTGFMLIKTEVLAKMLTAYSNPFMFFDDNEDGEDVAFCRRLAEQGYEIWAHPGLGLTHITIRALTMPKLEDKKDGQIILVPGQTRIPGRTPDAGGLEQVYRELGAKRLKPV